MTADIQVALDSSTDTAGLALAREGRIMAELSWECHQNHSVELLPRLEALMKENRVSWSCVNLIIVATGPGSYNGLRVGVSTAKGLAFGLGVPIAGISTLEAVAYPHAFTGLPICALLPAGGGEFCAAVYLQKDGLLKNTLAPHVSGINELCHRIRGRTIFSGELTPETVDTLCNLLGPKAIIPPPASRLRRAGFLAELGFKRFQAGNSDNPMTLQPIYLRRPQITLPKSLVSLNPGKS